MKIQQLEYVIAIAQEGSITTAAKKLFQAQPNISIALKELESNIGIQIFWRTPNGMVITPEGEEFLVRAKKIVEDMHSLEEYYTNKTDDGIKLTLISSQIPYLSPAIASWINSSKKEDKINIHIHENNVNRIIDEISGGRADIGVIRVPVTQSAILAEQLQSKKIICRTAMEFNMKLLMKRSHPLAAYDDVPFEKLKNYIQILHGDDELNVFCKNCINPDYPDDFNKKVIFAADKGNKLSLMNTLENSYMWVSPVPASAFPDYDVVVKKCSFAVIRNRDFIIYRESSENNATIQSCINYLVEFAAKMSKVAEE